MCGPTSQGHSERSLVDICHRHPRRSLTLPGRGTWWPTEDDEGISKTLQITISISEAWRHIVSIRLLLTIDETSHTFLARMAAQRHMPVATLALHYVLEGISRDCGDKAILYPRGQGAKDKLVKNRPARLWVDCAPVWEYQLKGDQQYWVFPPRCEARRTDGSIIRGGIWQLVRQDALGHDTEVLFTDGLPVEARRAQSGDYLRVYFLSEEELDEKQSKVLVEIVL